MRNKARALPVSARPVQTSTIEWAADIIDRQVPTIVSRWVRRMKTTIFRDRPELAEQLADRGPSMVRGVAEALRRSQPELIGAPWTTAAREHAVARRGQGVPIGDLIREYQGLREELWDTLQLSLSHLPGQDLLDLARSLDAALDTMARISTDTYGAELEREKQRAQFLAETARQLVSILDLDAILRTLSERATVMLGSIASVILVQQGEALAPRAFFSRQPGVWPAFEELISRQRVHPKEKKGWLPISDKPMLIPDVSTAALPANTRRRLQQLGVASYLAVPLRFGEQGLGILFTATTGRERRFTQQDLQLASELANIASLAITNALQTDQTRRRAEELSATLQSISDGLIIYGPNAKILRVNRQAERILGLPAAELADLSGDQQVKRLRVETPAGEPIPPDQVPWARALRGETVIGFRMVVHPPTGGARDILQSAGPIRDEQGRIVGAVATFGDITELTALQRRQQDVAYAVAHDIRQPLTAILGHAQLIERALAKKQTAQALASDQAIIRTARQMDVMVQDLLDSVRVQAGQLRLSCQPVDIANFLSDLLKRHSVWLETSRVKLAVTPDLPPAKADPDRLERIVLNLLTNALDYSPPGSPVDVQAEQRDGYIAVSVHNQGPGIPRQQLARLFQRFYRGPEPHVREGVGLGLYITRNLVEAHGGKIWADSRPGKGVTFHFTLPQTAAER